MANIDLLTKRDGWEITKDLTLTTKTTRVDIPRRVRSVRVVCHDVAGRVAGQGSDGGDIHANYEAVASGGSTICYAPKARGDWSIYVAGAAGALNYSVAVLS